LLGVILTDFSRHAGWDYPLNIVAHSGQQALLVFVLQVTSVKEPKMEKNNGDK
jgi:hypothetical protein